MSGECWEVVLYVDGMTMRVNVCIEPPFVIRCAQAECKAIKGKLAQGYKSVRALHSRWLSNYDLTATEVAP